MTALGTEVVLDAADYPALLTAAEAEAGRLGYHDEVVRGRDEGRLRGLGLALFLEKSGLGPQETADVIVGATGAVSVFSGGTLVRAGHRDGDGADRGRCPGCQPEVVRVVNGDNGPDAFGMGIVGLPDDRGRGQRGARRGAGRPRPRPAGRRPVCWRWQRTTWTCTTAWSAWRGDPLASVTLAEVARATAPTSQYPAAGRAGGAVRAAAVRTCRT